VALTRASALLSTAAEVVDLCGVQDLANLEADSEFSVADTLLRAHEWVYDMVEQRLGASAPALITNEARLERAVAARFLEVLYANGYLGDGDVDQRDYWQREARDEVDRYRPELSSGDEPRRTSEGVPLVGNFERGWEYAGPAGYTGDRVRPWLPETQ
jgi:hypothetical protein